jgi:ketosteroid isomerase-like protein
MYILRFGVALLLLVAVAPVMAQSANKDEVVAAIRASNILYGKAYERGDSLMFMNRYTNDAWIMAPGLPSLKGPKAAEQFYTLAYHQMGIRQVKLSTLEVVVQGSFATETGTFELVGQKGQTLDRGKYLVL